MRVRDVLKQFPRGSYVNVWGYTFGGTMHIGRWYVGRYTIYRLYQGSFEADSYEESDSMLSWGEWWKQHDSVNGYRNTRAIAKVEAADGTILLPVAY